VGGWGRKYWSVDVYAFLWDVVVHACMCVCVSRRGEAPMCIFRYTYLNMCINIKICVCMLVCMFVSMCVYIYTYMNIYAYTDSALLCIHQSRMYHWNTNGTIGIEHWKNYLVSWHASFICAT